MKAELLLQKAQEFEDRIVQERRTLHRNPETGFDLDNTLAFVKKELKDMGIEPADCGRAGVTALLGGKKPGKVFLLRADMDALPIREETGLDVAGCEGGYQFSYKRENPGEGDNYFVDIYRYTVDFQESDLHLQTEETDGYRLATAKEIQELADQGIFLHYDSIKKVFEV